MSTVKERGEASLVISLTEGRITVDHGTDHVTLGDKPEAQEGDWDRLIDFLKHELGVEWRMEGGA